jgi:hypothetical protein
MSLSLINPIFDQPQAGKLFENSLVEIDLHEAISQRFWFGLRHLLDRLIARSVQQVEGFFVKCE